MSMKKLLSLGCCILCAHSFSKVPVEKKTTDEKVIVKAILGIMNPEGGKKMPIKTVYFNSSEPF